MILIDSNIPIYLVGGAHRLKDRAAQAVSELTRNDERLVTDVEVFQEILHRYSAIGRRDAIDPCFSVLEQLVDEVFLVDHPRVERARHILHGAPALSARDALHASVMEAEGVTRILTFDQGFDVLDGIERLPRG